MAQPATVRGVVDERGEPLAARVLALGADDPVGRGPLVAGRLRLEEAPRRCVRAELALMAGLELCLFPLLVGVDAGAVLAAPAERRDSSRTHAALLRELVDP